MDITRGAAAAFSRGALFAVRSHARIGFYGGLFMVVSSVAWKVVVHSFPHLGDRLMRCSKYCSLVFSSITTTSVVASSIIRYTMPDPDIIFVNPLPVPPARFNALADPDPGFKHAFGERLLFIETLDLNNIPWLIHPWIDADARGDIINIDVDQATSPFEAFEIWQFICQLPEAWPSFLARKHCPILMSKVKEHLDGHLWAPVLQGDWD